MAKGTRIAIPADDKIADPSGNVTKHWRAVIEGLVAEVAALKKRVEALEG